MGSVKIILLLVLSMMAIYLVGGTAANAQFFFATKWKGYNGVAKDAASEG